VSFLDDLERDLLGAAERRRDARRVARAVRARQQIGLHAIGLPAALVRSAALHAARLRSAGLRRLVLATALFALIGTATAGAGLFVLRGSPIPGPAARDVPRDQLPLPGTTRLTGLTAADPEPGRPQWTLRLARSSTGLLCSTVGQLVGGRFGLVGLDGRFRTYSERVVDSCGEQQPGDRTSLIGARVFDADDPREVRTVVNGVGGRALRSVSLEVRGRRVTVPVGSGGTFLHVLRGYPEDSGLQVELRFTGGRVERHGLGVGPTVVVDPEGGRAWRVGVSSFSYSADQDRCVQFEPARPSRPRALSPSVCGRTRRGVPVSGAYFAVRRIEPGTGGWRAQFRGAGNWGAHPARTAVWGGFADDVERIEITGPGGLRSTPDLTARHIFLAVLPGSTDPEDVTVRVVLKDGSSSLHRGDTGLVEGRFHR
jgi:hypothetical protein